MSLDSEKTKLAPILNKMRDIELLPEDKKYVKQLISDIFSDLSSKQEASILRKYGKYIFSQFLDIQISICDRIFFYYFKGGLITDEGFVNSIYEIFFSNDLNDLQKLTFNIFSLSTSDIIYKEDVLIILIQLSYKTRIFHILEENINEFFGEANSLIFEEYCHIIQNTNSNIFFLILFFIYEKNPLTKRSIDFYKRVKQYNNCLIDFEDEINDEIEYTIADPSKSYKILMILLRIISHK